MLDYSVNATMFHMNNFNNYGGGRTVMTDFIEALYAKYNALYAAECAGAEPAHAGDRAEDAGPHGLQRLRDQRAVGVRQSDHAQDDPGGDDPADGCQLRQQRGDIRRPAHLVRSPMGANATVVIPGAAAKAPAAISGLTAALSGSDVVLNWPAVTQATDGSRAECAGLPGVCAGQRSDVHADAGGLWWRK